jgi:gamma-glutamylcyclotransferase (GGCT)/AIG2-like uncharacterized protein YtfP
VPTDRERLERLVAAANAANRDGFSAERAAVAALGDPDHRLVAYGTLRPGEVNDDVLADARGTWSPATVNGVMGEWHGYPILRLAHDAPPVAVMVLTSVDLPRLWPRLDRFEGPAYRREWVVCDSADGPLVGSCYVQA